MSKIQSQEPHASISTQDHTDHMAIRGMGTGYGRTIQDSQRWHDTSVSGSGQVHQVDRGKADQEAGGPTAVKFIVDITVRYGVPNSIITDNGTNFSKGTLARYASQSGIRPDVASVAHPQSNG